ncbi:MAG: flagellar M-ring protein FliF [Hyphomicrobiaceae bacterium]|nr:flagellar M-ring protein FliF [Hyphomicrobiaceae bacterium]
MNQITAMLNRLGLARIAAMGVVTIMLLGFFAFLIFRVTAPQMAPLYSGLSFDDSAAIVAELQSSGVPYELRGDGETILVPRDQITSVRMTLAGSGLPTNGQIGYEIFDQQSTLGATSFVQDVNLIRALEGELARTITSLAQVKTARVHLVLPKRELFRRERQDPTASVTLGIRGALNASEIRAIQHIIASAVEGMDPNAVSVIDDSGRLLASGNTDTANGVVGTDLDERTVAVETRLKNAIEDLLTNVVGAGRARVQVTAELETTRSTKSSETFDPNGQVVRSSQTRDLANSSTGETPSGQVSVGQDLPNANQSTATPGAATDQSKTTEETVNYEISKETQTDISEAGSIKRLSVAVVVDGIYVSDANGNSTYQPRTAQEIDQINNLVRSAMGFDETRGDQLQVVNLQFAERPDLVTAGTSEPSLFDFTRDDLMSAAEMAVTALIGLALIFFVMRPLVRKVLTPEDTLALPEPTMRPVSTEEALTEVMHVPDDPEKKAMMDAAKRQGAAHARTIETVGSLVSENPRQSSVIVRDWLTEAA